MAQHPDDNVLPSKTRTQTFTIGLTLHRVSDFLSFMEIPSLSFLSRQVSEISERVSELVPQSIRVARVFTGKVAAIAEEHLSCARIRYENRMP